MTRLTFSGTMRVAGQTLDIEFSLPVDRASFRALLAAIDAEAFGDDEPVEYFPTSAPQAGPHVVGALTAPEPDFDDDGLEVAPRRGSEIRLSHLRPGDDAHNWTLLARRFPWLFAPDVNPVKLVAKQIEAAAETAQQADQTEQDFETIEPMLDELIDFEAGEFKYGHQSAIARALGGTNAGAFRKDRVLPLEAYLQERFLSEAKAERGAA